MRKQYNLLHKTYFVPMTLEDLPLDKYREQIRKNRENNKIYVGHRNTPSYFILMTGKFHAVKSAIEINPFNSNYFAWIDFGISHLLNRQESYGETEAKKHLTEIFDCYRNKFSMCYINYTQEAIVRDYKQYYVGDGRCGTAATFMTANKDYFLKVIDDFNVKVIKTIEAGYGHADEQILPLIYLDHQDWFEFYYGDYYYILSNYAHYRNGLLGTLYRFLPAIRNDGKFNLCYDSTTKILDAIDNNYIKINDDDLFKLLDEYFISAWYSNHKHKCFECINRFIDACRRKSFNDIMRINAKHILSNTDFIYSQLRPEKTILINNRISDDDIKKLIKTNRVFIIANDIDNFGSSFIICNPVIRTINCKANIKYDLVM